MLNSCSYLFELEARIRAYENEREESSVNAGSVTAASEGQDTENASPGSLNSRYHAASSVGLDTDDIDNNPLIEGTARLELSPEGDRRKKAHESMRHALIFI